MIMAKWWQCFIVYNKKTGRPTRYVYLYIVAILYLNVNKKNHYFKKTITRKMKLENGNIEKGLTPINIPKI